MLQEGRLRLAYFVFVAIVLGLGLLVGWAFLPGAWYAGLEKPGFTPPNWVFAPAWSTLYVLIGLAGARCWIADRGSAGMVLWFAQLVLNLMWSPAFFGAESPALGLLVILPLFAIILAFIAERWSQDRIAALLFVPYAFWVGYASALNLAIWRLN